MSSEYRLNINDLTHRYLLTRGNLCRRMCLETCFCNDKLCPHLTQQDVRLSEQRELYEIIRA